MSTERIIVDESIADAFVAEAGQGREAARRRSARPCRARLVDRHRPCRADGRLHQGRRRQRRRFSLRRQSRRHDRGSDILDHVTPAMRIYGEESFGPVKSVIRVNGVDEAVRVANDTEYGLSAAVFSRTSCAPWTSPNASTPASATSTARRCMTRRKCRSAASRRPAMAGLAARSAIDEFTDLRWITIEGPATLSVLTLRYSDISEERPLGLASLPLALGIRLGSPPSPLAAPEGEGGRRKRGRMRSRREARDHKNVCVEGPMAKSRRSKAAFRRESSAPYAQAGCRVGIVLTGILCSCYVLTIAGWRRADERRRTAVPPRKKGNRRIGSKQAGVADAAGTKGWRPSVKK